jgi:HAMP domain-containing protein
MRRLYLRIYFAVVASLAVFALVAGLAWRGFAEPWWSDEALGTVARNILPPAGGGGRAAGRAAAAGARSAHRPGAVRPRRHAHRAGRTADRGTAAGRAPAPHARPAGVGCQARRRALARRARTPPRGPGIGIFILALILLAIAVGAYPVVRRLTLRLERLQRGVTALGEGDLSARVRVEGRDEVARLAESFNQAAERIERSSARTSSCWRAPRTSCARRSPASAWRSSS